MRAHILVRRKAESSGMLVDKTELNPKDHFSFTFSNAEGEKASSSGILKPREAFHICKLIASTGLDAKAVGTRSVISIQGCRSKRV